MLMLVSVWHFGPRIGLDSSIEARSCCVPENSCPLWSLIVQLSFRFSDCGPKHPAGSCGQLDPCDLGVGWQVSMLHIRSGEHCGRCLPLGMGKVFQCWPELRGSGLRAVYAGHTGRSAACTTQGPGGLLWQGASNLSWSVPRGVSPTLVTSGGTAQEDQRKDCYRRREQPGGQIHRWVL